ncbi:RNA polymerase sigma factor [Streptomyces abikoensis]|uniref:RNA polymerase sigma factor n=1 Tax=Streptomyces abikoensis TaxID=97398 RepID=A0ABW7T4Y6_9ACTN
MTARHAVLRAATQHTVVYDSFVLRKRSGYVNWAFTRLHSLEDAREAANEAFFKLYLRWEDALASANTDAYAFKILRDVVTDTLRKRDRRPSVPIGLAFEATVHPVAGIPDEEIEQVSARLEIHHAVTQLPERQRTCISLHYFLGYPVEEIADITGLADSTVRSHLAAGRNALATLLDPPADEPPAAHEKGHHG